MSDFVQPGMGWLPDLPDPRDYTLQDDIVTAMFGQGESLRKRTKVPTQVDLRANDGEWSYLPSVANQETLSSSSVHACIALVQYFQRRAEGTVFEASSRFLYKTARKLRGLTGDAGIDLRTTLKALLQFGVPPERFWPADSQRFDDEPTDPMLYSYTGQLADAVYVRLDHANVTGSRTLDSLKSCLAAGLPVAFGFVVPATFSQRPDIPYRPQRDTIRGGQAALAVGYDDGRFTSHKGAVLIRNSWGEDWGENGYGWLPYAYVEQQLAADFWTLLSPTWLASGEFGCPDATPKPRRPRRKRKSNGGDNGQSS